MILFGTNAIFTRETQTRLGQSAKNKAGIATDSAANCWLIHGEGGMNKLLFAQIGNIWKQPWTRKLL